ncbi:MAG: UbiD family decarboxylase [Thaumarchaeota archaeon]|nr:UbiD family decarboxylase [Nitrososphaerota archaeon]
MSMIGEIKEVKEADWNLEIGAVTDLNAKSRGPALLFDNVKGYPKGYRVLTCMLSGPKRLSYVLGSVPTGDHHKLVSDLEGKPAEWEEIAGNYSPKERSDSPLFENRFTKAEDIDLFKFPTPLWHNGDGGRYIGTGGAVITKDPESGVVNLGTYRVMISDRKTLVAYIADFHHGNLDVRKYLDKGQRCPIALSFGHDPALYLSASLPIPHGLSEYQYAGSIGKKSIDYVIGPITGLAIPANSEIVAEGYIEPNDLVEEGPFGEYTGYFAEPRTLRPAIRVQAIYHRNDPIILGSLTGKPPFDHSYWRSAVLSAAVKDRLRKAGVSNVVKVWRHEAGCSQFFTVVSIRQQYLGHARQAGFIAAQCEEGAKSMGRFVVVVDEDIDPSDLGEVVWALSTRTDPATCIDFIRRAPSIGLDPMIRKPTDHYSSSRAVIDACKPFEWISEFPKSVEINEELVAVVKKKWPDLLS